MTDDNLREAAARALGWAPAGLGQWYVPMTEPKGVVLRDQAPPLDWITAGELLELCARSGDKNRIYLGGAFVFLKYVDLEEVEWSGEITPRNVIEACVMALDTQPTTP